tara:strand:+ start:2507 stop:6820 length:4314 start_codon:yes stop_codon:yes gene_type:complete
MNINEHYFKNSPENLEKKDIENELKKDIYVLINSGDRLYENETMWNFKIKFGAEGDKIIKSPIRKMSDNGVTYEGFTYYPWNFATIDGKDPFISPMNDIIGFKEILCKGDSGCTISQRMKDIMNINVISLELSRDLTDSIPNFNNILNISCEELSGFSNIHSTNNENISFIATLTESTNTTSTYTTISSMNFKIPINIQNLSLKFTNHDINLENYDRAELFWIRINNKNNLELVLKNIPSSFKKDQKIILPENTIINSENSQSQLDYNGKLSVIDGYIKDALVIVRDLEGNVLCKDLSNTNGVCMTKFKNGSKILILTADGGIDMSYNGKNKLEFRALYNPFRKKLQNVQITPITTLLADYVIYKEKKQKNIRLKVLENSSDDLREALNLKNIDTDYIKTKNLKAAITAYRIVNLTYTGNYLLKKFVKNYNLGSSYFSTKLALSIIDNSLNINTLSHLEIFIKNLIDDNTIGDNKLDSNQLKNISLVLKKLLCHNCFDNEDVSFELLGKASLAFHKDLDTGFSNQNLFNGELDYKKIVEIREKLDISSGKEIEPEPKFKMNIIVENIENISIPLKKSIERVLLILEESIIKKYVLRRQPLIKIFEKDFGNNYSLSNTFYHVQKGEIIFNKEFDTKMTNNKFLFNGIECSVYVPVLLHEIINIIIRRGNKLFEHVSENRDDILYNQLSQNSFISMKTLDLIQANGYIVNMESIFVHEDWEKKSVNYVNYDYKKQNNCDGKSELILGEPLPLKCINSIVNTPIFDSKKICKINEILLKIDEQEETLNIILNVHSKLDGYICLIPNMYIDKIHVYSERLIRTRVKNGKNIEVNLNLSKNFELISKNDHLLKFEISFYFGSNSSISVKCVNTYIIKNSVKWAKLSKLESDDNVVYLKHLEELEFKEEEVETREYLLIPGERDDDDLIGYEEPVPYEEALFGIIEEDKIEYDRHLEQLGLSKFIVKSLFLENYDSIYPSNSSGNESCFKDFTTKMYIFTLNKIAIFNTSFTGLAGRGGMADPWIADNVIDIPENIIDVDYIWTQDVSGNTFLENGVYILFSKKISIYWDGYDGNEPSPISNDASGTKMELTDPIHFENLQGCSLIKDENILVVIDDKNSNSRGAIHVIDVSDKTRMSLIYSVIDDNLKGCYRIVCNNKSDSQKAYIISRSENALIEVDLNNNYLPTIESKFTSELLKDPRSIVYIKNKELVLLVCYISKMVLVFDVNSSLKLIRAIATKYNPLDVAYNLSEDNLGLTLYISNNSKQNPISEIELYDSSGVLQVYNQVTEFKFTESSQRIYNNLYYEESIKIDSSGNESEHGRLFCISTENNGTVDVYARAGLDVGQDPNSLDKFKDCKEDFQEVDEIDTNGEEYKILSINRDISGNHLLELDKQFLDTDGEKLANMNLVKDNNNSLILNKNLQANITIGLTSQILLDDKKYM